MASPSHNLLHRVSRWWRRRGGRRTALQRKSRDYWRACGDSFLANPAYYQRVEQHLRDVAQRHLRPDDVLTDYGCGNGRLTLILADYCRRVFAFDLSETLIKEAIDAKARLGVEHVDFAVVDLAADVPDRGATVISCQGVFSCILDDRVFDRILDRFASLLPAGGRLLLRDTLARKTAHVYEPDYGYVAWYRRVADYEAAITRRGFRLLESTQLRKKKGADRVNRFYVYERVQ